MFRIERRQHPVGQGFFHSTTIEHRGSHLHYVYDCGSENTSALQREVRGYASRLEDPISLLFLSHLDHDHVNGLDTLLALVRADTVVLPYLSVYERIGLAVRAVERDAMDVSYLELVSDPVGWLQSRRVSRIIFVDGAEDQDPSFPEGSPPPDPDLNHENARKPPSLTADLGPLGPPTTRRGQRGTVAIQRVPGDRAIPVVARDHSHFDWYLLPFVHPEPRQEPSFRRHVVALWNGRFGATPFPVESRSLPPSFSSWLLEQVQHKERRDHLADSYSKIRLDRNLTSMSLYSGPLHHSRELSTFYNTVRGNGEPAYPYWHRSESLEIGWLATGDADLRGERRRAAFMRHYQRVLANVGTMALPHHGSRHNFHQDIMPGSVHNYLVGVGTKNSYGHPHDEVTSALALARKELLRVDEENASLFQETIVLH